MSVEVLTGGCLRGLLRTCIQLYSCVGMDVVILQEALMGLLT